MTGVESVTITRRSLGARDDHGLPTETTTTIVVDGVLVAFGSTDQPVSNDSSAQNTQVTLYFPHGTVIQTGDEFEVRGQHFVKDGRAMDWISPFAGQFAGVVVNVRQTLG